MSLRYQLQLGKFPVIEVLTTPNGKTVTIDIDGKNFIRFNAPLNSDVIVTDLLTLYTEVLAEKRKQ